MKDNLDIKPSIKEEIVDTAATVGAGVGWTTAFALTGLGLAGRGLAMTFPEGRLKEKLKRRSTKAIETGIGVAAFTYAFSKAAEAGPEAARAVRQAVVKGVTG